MASIAAPDKRRKKPPLLLLDARTSSDFPTGSSESFVVPELPMAFDMSANSNASTASEMTSTSSSASASSSNRGVKWWKRVTAMRAKRRRSGSKQESRPSLDQELYVRSILESYASSMSSNNRYSTSNPQPSRLAPTFRIKLAANHSEFFSPAYSPPQVADYVPLLPLACADLEVTRRLANDARARGGHVCWYVCCGLAFPNQFVSSPLVEGELVGYLSFFELDGFLRWNYCLWPSRPWDDLRWRAPMWKVGDTYFVLPGRDGWPVDICLRMKTGGPTAWQLFAVAIVFDNDETVVANAELRGKRQTTGLPHSHAEIRKRRLLQ
ncbi:hypothetical protein PInf_021042 [Phytophthora infestans]|nr:hypothetical protein PInf_021042 [Phytophthora infestans]